MEEHSGMGILYPLVDDNHCLTIASMGTFEVADSGPNEVMSEIMIDFELAEGRQPVDMGKAVSKQF